MNQGEIKDLLVFIEKLSFKEVEIEQEGIRIKVSKGENQASSHSVIENQDNNATVESSLDIENDKNDDNAILSPLPAVFYSAPAPDAKPFVKVGDVIKKDETVCILEAMKMMNEISMPEDGIITAIHAKDSEAVEVDQVLFSYTPQ